MWIYKKYYRLMKSRDWLWEEEGRSKTRRGKKIVTNHTSSTDSFIIGCKYSITNIRLLLPILQQLWNVHIMLASKRHIHWKENKNIGMIHQSKRRTNGGNLPSQSGHVVSDSIVVKQCFNLTVTCNSNVLVIQVLLSPFWNCRRGDRVNIWRNFFFWRNVA